jgi:hypothetical protein
MCFFTITASRQALGLRLRGLTMLKSVAVVPFVLWACSFVFAAQPRPPIWIQPPVHFQPNSPGLQQLIFSAGYVFEGKVVRVEQVDSSAQVVETIQITFQVLRGVRGVRSGQSFTIREWAGLWNAGERYRPGENVVLFLYPPSRLGLTSPVGGPLGRFAMDTTGEIMLNEAQNALLSSTPAPFPIIQPPVRIAPEKFFQIIRQEEER